MTTMLLAASLAVTNLPPVTVSASRIDATAVTIPASLVALDHGDIAVSGADSLPELLERRVNMHVRTLNANPLRSQLAMRGFGENSFGRIRVMVDGVRLDGVDMEPPDLAGIPLDGVRRVEVLRGPCPVLYGDGAVAGVISVETGVGGSAGSSGTDREAAQRTELTAKAGTQANFGLGLHTQGGDEDGQMGYSADYDYSRSAGYRDRSGYGIHSANASLSRDFENGSRLWLRTDYGNGFYEMPGALPLAGWRDRRRYAVYRDDWCRLWNYGIGLGMKAKLAEDQWLMADLAFSYRHRRAHWGDYGYANEYGLAGTSISPRYVCERDLFDFGNRFTLGAEFEFDRYGVTDDSGFNNHHYHFIRSRYAGFANEEFSIADTLTLSAGTRLETIGNRWAHYCGLSRSHRNDLEGDFELALVFSPMDYVKAYAKGTRFHRSAFCDEMNYTENGELLRPETGESLDLGLELEPADEFKFDLDAYATRIDDEIFYNPHAKDYGGAFGGFNCNSPSPTERFGFDGAIEWCRERVAEAAFRYSPVVARFAGGEYRGEAVPLVPNHRMRLEAGIWMRDDLVVKGGCGIVSRQYLSGDFGNDHGRIPGYVTFDLALRYEPGWAEGWKVSLSLDNLLDRRYCDFAGWADYGGAYCYPSCGRSLLVTLTIPL